MQTLVAPGFTKRNENEAIMVSMADFNVLSDEFAHVVEDACAKARSVALEAGHQVVYRSSNGSYVAEHPGGRRFEVRFDPTRSRESHLVVLREISSNAA